MNVSCGVSAELPLALARGPCTALTKGGAPSCLASAVVGSLQSMPLLFVFLPLKIEPRVGDLQVRVLFHACAGSPSPISRWLLAV